MKDAYKHKHTPGEAGAPLLFLFHGTGGNEKQLSALGEELLPGATIVAPRGDVKEGRAARFFRRTGEGVYDMDDLARATEKMAGFVKAHAEEADGPVFGLGYSNGANILASVVFAEPELFSAAVLMHPLIPFVPRITGGLAGRRILITAGEADPICPPELVTRLETYLKAAGAEVETVWHEGGHEMQPTEVEAAQRFLGQAAGDMKARET
jgi:phospholipase/carboxylesterase